MILINRGTFRGHEGVRQLAQMLGEELPEHRAFDYTYRAVEGRVAFLEWAYEDDNVRVKDGADSYLIEDGIRWPNGIVIRADVILWCTRISQLPRSSGAADAT